jgi:hypothetical protein
MLMTSPAPNVPGLLAPEPTLNEALRAFGYETRRTACPASYRRVVVRGGRTVHVGDAHANTAWLERLGGRLIARAVRPLASTGAVS